MCNSKIVKVEQTLAYLTINSSYLSDLGLFHGKMGIVLFFFELARASQNVAYEGLASNLLDEIYDEIHYDLPINLENGLCGIGWGMEYLVQHGFMEGDTDEILADIDQKVMEINPLRMKDFSLRRGLGGIAFYVLARLNANRQSDTLPFDDTYLEALQKAVSQIDYSKEKEIPFDLSVSLQREREGRHINLQLPSFLTSFDMEIPSFDDVLLGLENGLTGWLWNKCVRIKFLVPIQMLPIKEKCIFLFEVGSRSMNYGIGTYMNQLTEIQRLTNWQVVRIRLLSERTDSFLFHEDRKVICLDLAKFKNWSEGRLQEKYYKNIFYWLYSYFQSVKNSIFHLNSMQDEILATLLKEYFPQRPIVLTVHYTDWSFKLLGNKEKLQTILTKPVNGETEKTVTTFYSEKRLLNTVDYIVAIAQHSYKDILNLYQIQEKKIALIPHGLKDEYRPMTITGRNNLRKKYGFNSEEQLLLFAGRIDFVKGTHFLCEAFMQLVKEYPNLRLIIVGDGNLEYLLTLQKPIWSKITCTGYVDKETLYELYAISDIGVLPSFHEEFGLVALEMMMMKLPLIVGRTTGLSELVNHEESGLQVYCKKGSREKSVSFIKEAITELLNDKDKQKRFAEQGRKRYLQQYTLEAFLQRMKSLYEECTH